MNEKGGKEDLARRDFPSAQKDDAQRAALNGQKVIISAILHGEAGQSLVGKYDHYLVLQLPPASIFPVHQTTLNVRNLRNADNAPQLATRDICTRLRLSLVIVKTGLPVQRAGFDVMPTIV